MGESERKERHLLAALTLLSQVSHDFAINFDPENPECEGKEGRSSPAPPPPIQRAQPVHLMQGHRRHPHGPPPCPLAHSAPVFLWDSQFLTQQLPTLLSQSLDHPTLLLSEELKGPGSP